MPARERLRSQASTDLPAHHCVVLPHLDRLEAACVVDGPRAAEMACVVLFGFVVGIPLDPGRTAGGGIRDHAIEQC